MQLHDKVNVFYAYTQTAGSVGIIHVVPKYMLYYTLPSISIGKIFAVYLQLD